MSMHAHTGSHAHAHTQAPPKLTPGLYAKSHPLPKLPDIGRHEAYYAEMIRRADCAGDKIAHESWKVGQYISEALNPSLTWEKKLRYFDHALRRHCMPPTFADEKVLVYFQSLADLVRRHAGAEILRIASKEDDLYALRLQAGQARHMVLRDAHVFFTQFAPGDECPEWMNEDDYAQLKLIRSQWM